MASYRQVPVMLFGMVLGVAGLGSSWRVAAHVWGLPIAVADALAGLALVIWVWLLLAYVVKWARDRAAAVAELRHPVDCCFISLIPASLSVLSVAVLPLCHACAEAAYVVAAMGQFAFGLYRTGVLWKGGTALVAVTPVLYLPTVAGNLTSALAAASLGYTPWAIFFLGIGVLNWLALESVLVFRYLTGPEIEPAHRAALGLHLAPPAVVVITWLSIFPGEVGLVPQLAWAYAAFVACLLLRLLPWITLRHFAIGLWSFSFGVTALSTGALTMLDRGVRGAVTSLSLTAFVLANVCIILLTGGTLRQVKGLPRPPPS